MLLLRGPWVFLYERTLIGIRRNSHKTHLQNFNTFRAIEGTQISKLSQGSIQDPGPPYIRMLGRSSLALSLKTAIRGPCSRLFIHSPLGSVVIAQNISFRNTGFILSRNFPSLAPEPLSGNVSTPKCYFLMFSTLSRDFDPRRLSGTMSIPTLSYGFLPSPPPPPPNSIARGLVTHSEKSNETIGTICAHIS